MTSRSGVALMLLIVLAGCAGRPGTAPMPATGSWLVGLWLPVEDKSSRSLAECESDAPIRYLADGSYVMFEERGEWQLEGNQLTHVTREIFESGDDADRALIGKPFTARADAVSANEARIIHPDGSAMRLLRCPTPSKQ